jgi:hypothetical protein
MRLRLLMVGVVFLSVALVYGQDRGGPPQKDEPPKRGEPGGRSRGPADKRPEQAPSPFARGGIPAHPQWEYAVKSRRELGGSADGELSASLNKMGEEGWELVTIDVGGTPANASRTTYVFKRPKGPRPRTDPLVGFAPGNPPDGRLPAFGRPGLGGVGGLPGGTAPTPGEPGARGGRRVPPSEPQGLGDIQIHPLKHTQARAVVQILNQVYGPGRAGLRLASDDTSNSLLVGGTEEQVKQVLKLVDQLEQLARDAHKERERAEPKRKQ